MMMSGKDFLKSHVLRWRRKVYSDWEDVTSSGRTFQVFEPASVVVCVKFLYLFTSIHRFSKSSFTTIETAKELF